MPNHEGDLLRRRGLGRDYEISFVRTVIVVDDHDEAPAGMAATAVGTALAEGRRVIFSPVVSEERDVETPC